MTISINRIGYMHNQGRHGKEIPSTAPDTCHKEEPIAKHIPCLHSERR